MSKNDDRQEVTPPNIRDVPDDHPGWDRLMDDLDLELGEEGL